MAIFKHKVIYASSYFKLIEKLSKHIDEDWVQYGDITSFFFGLKYKVGIKKKVD